MKEGYWRDLGLADQEYQLITGILGREPNEVELGMFGVMWSKHSSYQNSKAVLQTLPTKGPRVLQGPGENAGMIDIGQGQAVVFKIGSSNHPAALEPYQGVATGAGGVVLDIIAMGARPVALLDSLRFGSLKSKKARDLLSGVASGIAGYGNCIGLPTVGGEVYFHPSYEDNCLVNVMCLGFIDKQDIAREAAAGPGNPVMVVGSRMGRDGIHGAEKRLLEACLELNKTGYVVDMQPLGAAGLTGASCAIAARAGKGIEMDIARVPRRETGMTPDEALLSEPQERMLVVVKDGREKEVRDIFAKWGLEAVAIGHVTADDCITVKSGERMVARIPTQTLTGCCPVNTWEAREPAYLAQAQEYDLTTLPEHEDYNQILLTLLGTGTIASKEWVYSQYDYMVGLNTVLGPGSDAAVLRVKETTKGIAVTVDCNSRYVYLDPYRGGQIAVAEAARNLVCSGAVPLAVTGCLNFGNPERPEIYWQFKEAVAGLGDACRELETPVTGVNVSFYNETNGESIYPTPVVGMVGLVEDLSQVTTPAFKNEGDIIILLGQTKDELGASTYISVIHGLEAGRPPEINLQLEKLVQKSVHELIKEGLVTSAHDCAEGGLAVALAECCIAGGLGAEVMLTEGPRASSYLFGESQSRIVLTTSKERVDQVFSRLKQMKVPYRVIGNVGGTELNITGSGWKVRLEVAALEEKYRGAIPCIMNS